MRASPMRSQLARDELSSVHQGNMSTKETLRDAEELLKARTRELGDTRKALEQQREAMADMEAALSRLSGREMELRGELEDAYTRLQVAQSQVYDLESRNSDLMSMWTETGTVLRAIITERDEQLADLRKAAASKVRAEEESAKRTLQLDETLRDAELRTQHAESRSQVCFGPLIRILSPWSRHAPSKLV